MHKSDDKIQAGGSDDAINTSDGVQHECMSRGKYRVGSYSHYTSGSRGVMILFRKTTPFHIKKTWGDKYGCYTAVHGKWEGEDIIIINVWKHCSK